MAEPASDKVKKDKKMKEKKREKRETDEPEKVTKKAVEKEEEGGDAAGTIFSSHTFVTLPIGEKTKAALTALGFSRMTQIQAQAIPHALEGSDVVGAAKTGSGKTLAFLVPIIELLTKVNFTRQQGAGAIIISPTRELSLQIYGVLRDLLESAGHPQTHGLIMGGANRKAEADKLIKGINIVVATPGRLLDHLTNTQGFNFQRLQVLVIDEADRILEVGFEEGE